MVRTSRRFSLCFLTLLHLLFSTPTIHAAAAEASTSSQDRWYVMLIEGKPSGWLHESASEEQGTITSSSHTKLSMRRGRATIVVETQTKFTESAQGKPLRVVQIMTMGAAQTIQTIDFLDDHLAIETKSSGQTTRTKAPLPEGQWMPPAAAGRYVIEKLGKKETDIAYNTIDPNNDLKPFKVHLKITGSEDLEVLGKTVPSLTAETTFSNLPGITSKQHIDSDGRLLKMTLTPMPGFSITALLADRDLAMAQVDPPELLASTFIHMKQPIRNPRQLQSAVYELTFKPSPKDDDNKKLTLPDLPKVGFQRIVQGNERKVRVAIDLSSPVAPGDDLPGKEHRAASAALNSDDDKIKELVTTALKGKGDKLTDTEKAETLRAYVHRYIRKKDLSVGFAFASEVARTRQGDCTEHGVLLAAMLRAAGLPSRTASGLIYIDQFAGQKNIFGYHMWAQAWVQDEKHGGYWLDLDATLADPGFDAAHITLSVSAMTDGAANDMMQLVPLIGRLEIKVIESKGK